MMYREEATEQILQAKRERGLTYAGIAEKLGTHKEWTTAALLGQHPMNAGLADGVVDLLDLDPEVDKALQEISMRGSLEQDVPMIPRSTGYTRLPKSTAPPSKPSSTRSSATVS